jgi:hypothetical protein
MARCEKMRMWGRGPGKVSREQQAVSSNRWFGIDSEMHVLLILQALLGKGTG